ncbi:MAG: hypothetical protein V3V96_09900, partial [Acidiferrobacterales bacterium]
MVIIDAKTWGTEARHHRHKSSITFTKVDKRESFASYYGAVGCQFYLAESIALYRINSKCNRNRTAFQFTAR